ncbi:MAG: MBL fold metallo-hydrolase [Clostridia bacterium]
MASNDKSKKNVDRDKKIDKTKKKVVREAKKQVKKHKGLQIAIVCIVIAIIVTIVVLYFVKPTLFDFLKPNKAKDVSGITPIVGEKLEMNVIDVGQGDSILFTMPDGKTMLIDIGSEFKTTSCWDAVDAKLKEKNIKSLDYLFITHTDYDHIREVKRLCQEYEIKSFYLPNVAPVMSSTWNKLWDAKDPVFEAETYKDANGNLVKTPINYNLGSYVIEGAGWKMNCYTYDKTDKIFNNFNNDISAEKKNAISPICILEYAGRKICLTGDANEMTEEYVLSKGYLDNVDVDILKVGHHGSRSSTTQAFLDKIDPEFAIISASIDNSYKHPHAELITRLQQYKDIKPDKDYDGFGDANAYRIYTTSAEGTCTAQIGSDGTMNVISQKNEANNRTIVGLSLVTFENNDICLVSVFRKDDFQTVTNILN